MVQRIVVDRNVLTGKPIVKGTRISVEFILEVLSSGVSIDELLNDYPQLTRKDVLAALEYAAKTMKHEEVHSIAQLA